MSFYMQFLVFIKIIFSRSKLVFVETMYAQPGIRYFVSALSEELAGADGYQIKIQGVSQEVDPMTDEMRGRTILFRYSPLFLGFLLGLHKILGFVLVAFFHRRGRIFKLSYCGADLSNEFDDVMDINLGLGWQNSSDIAALKRAVIEISYASFIATVFFFFKHRIKWVITADSAYRYGFIVKIAQSCRIPVITNIDLNGLFMNFYSPKTLAGPRGRKITEEDCAKVQEHFPKWRTDIAEYFRKRFAGEVIQHDVLNAYKGGGRNFEFGKPLCIKENSDGVVVTLFAHVFCDAPRNIPGTLFGDFYRWFVESVRVLVDNPNVLLYIREHPSAHLYGEKNLVSQILAQMGVNDRVTLWGEVTTDVVLEGTDVVVTCSGTVGLEAAYLGKPVVISSRCSYSQLGLCHEFETKKDYLSFLAGISPKVGLPAAYQAEKAALVAFIHFNIFNNRNRYVDFPLPPFVRGVEFGKSGEEFFRNIREYVSGQTLFHTDLCKFLDGYDSRFVPELVATDCQSVLGSGSCVACDDFLFDYSVVIVGFRSHHVITTCLDALIRAAQATSLRIQVIVVDNDPERSWETLREIERQNYSRDSSTEMLLIESPRNGGFSFGCNLGAKLASGRWVLFLNPDAFVAESFFPDIEHDLRFISETVQDDLPVVMGITMIDAKGQKTRNGGILPERFALQRRSNRMIYDGGYMLKINRHDVEGLVWPLGAGFLVSNGVFKDAGGFDEGLFLTLEEPTFLKKLQRYVLYFSKATAVHEGGHSYSNRLAEYTVLYRSLKYYWCSFKFNTVESAKIVSVLLRVRMRILLLRMATRWRL